ncbi:hypothetical protein BJP40_21340 [Streptomyces sp. CC53]|nr:hypothetical protein [Streptomyces sp. C8S0]OII64187.1 hypothetical protein BJP40_21340 [Streptomyces sp. CC53]OII66697.1 hypothetical protein BJP39_08055 [Streptomyces sp. CC77]
MPELVRAMAPERGGVLWKLAAGGRQLDANVVRLAPGAEVASHVEPDLDVLVYVVNGNGRLDLPDGSSALEGGCVVWLPSGSRRSLAAGPHGMDYVTVHRRRPGMAVGRGPGAAEAAVAPGPERAGGEAACLLDRVCPDCGRLAPDTPGIRFCGYCGSRLSRD